MKSRIQGTVLHLQALISGSLDVLRDLVAMGWTENERAEDQHVQRPL